MSIRCEGYRRHGGVFSLGPVTWSQCTGASVVMLTIRKEGEAVTLPACQRCWDECIEGRIRIIKARPIGKRKPEKGEKP